MPQNKNRKGVKSIGRKVNLGKPPRKNWGEPNQRAQAYGSVSSPQTDSHKASNLKQKTDYLAEMRQHRLDDESKGIKRLDNEKTIDHLLHDKNLNEYERLEAVKRKAQ